MLHLMKSKDKIFAKKRTLIQNFKDKKHKYVDVSIIHTTTQTPIIKYTLTGVSNSGTTRIPLNLAYSKIIAMSSLV